jgi:hypothetical protein
MREGTVSLMPDGRPANERPSGKLYQIGIRRIIAG